MNSFVLYLRHRPCVKVPGYFLELYLEWNDIRKQLEMPLSFMKRFEGREVKRWTYTIRDTWPERKPGPSITIIATNSSAHKEPVRRTYKDITQNGTWCAFHDLSLQGGPIGQSKATIFGVPIDSTLDYTLIFSIRDIYDMCSTIWPVDIHCEPRVIYHGTARENVKSIISEGLRPTFGMLGTGIYFGTFWKSFRFATRTQDYIKRQGAILRYYSFWNRVQYKSTMDDPCQCEKCKKLLSKKRVSKVERERNYIAAQFCDHDAKWSKDNFFDAIMAFPILDGPIKNMECMSLDDTKVLLDSIGHVESTTEHHEPLNRDITIL